MPYSAPFYIFSFVFSFLFSSYLKISLPFVQNIWSNLYKVGDEGVSLNILCDKRVYELLPSVPSWAEYLDTEPSNWPFKINTSISYNIRSNISYTAFIL